MTAPELLPCPFCGCEAVLCRPPFGRPYVCCNANFCSGPKDTDDEAIATWNRRTPSPEVAALIAEARREGWNAAIEAANWLGLTFYDKVPKGSLTSVTILEYREAIRALKETTHD